MKGFLSLMTFNKGIIRSFNEGIESTRACPSSSKTEYSLIFFSTSSTVSGTPSSLKISNIFPLVNFLSESCFMVTKTLYALSSYILLLPTILGGTNS